MKKHKASGRSKSASKPKIVPKVSKTDSQSVSQKGLKIRPLGDRVLVRPSLASETEKKNDFGIIIPETVSKERPEHGEIIAVGEGKYENGKLVPVKVKVGDKVVFSKYGFDEVKVDEEELYILKEENILAIIKR